MECQECQERPATLHFTQLINGNKTETHICEVCAKEIGYMMYPEEGYSLHNLLAGLFNFDSNHLENHSENTFEQLKESHCPKCDLTFSEFKQIGKFGCAECYQTFTAQLDPILRRVHSGNTMHSGKIPKRKGGSLLTKKQLEMYQSELQQLIENEAFEEAALVRDKIRKLKEEQYDSKAGEEK